MNTNSKKSASIHSPLNTRSFRRSPKAFLTATFATICLTAISLTTTHAATNLLGNSDFSSTANSGTIGGTYTSGTVSKVLGSGPWSAQTLGKGHDAPEVLIQGGTNGYAEIINATMKSSGTPQPNASIFQSLSAVYQANTTYTLSVDVTSSSFTSNITNDSKLLSLDDIGIALTKGGTTTSPGTFVVDSIDNLSDLKVSYVSSGTIQLTLTYTTGNTAPSGNIGVSLFAGSTQNCSGDCVKFDNASLTTVPEPSTFVLAGIFGFGMLALFRRYRYVE